MAYSLSWLGNIPPGGGGGSGALGLLQDWVDRSTASGVVQAIRFDVAANATDHAHVDGSQANVVQNATGGILGDGALRINVPASSGSNPGAWRVPLNSSWTTDSQGIGSNDYYWQFRFKLGANRFMDDAGGTGVENGFKICNISEYKQSSPNSSHSHINGEIVLQFHGELSQILIAYRDAASAGGQSAEMFVENDSPTSGDLRHQNAIDNGSGFADKYDRYCLYQSGAPANNLSAGCVTFEEEVWYTIYCHVKIVTYDGTTGNIFEMSYAGPTDTSYTPLYSLTNQLMGYDPVDGVGGPSGIWLLPYKTSRTSGTVDTYHEYDQVIVSTAPIACPQPLPAWFSTSLNTWFDAGTGSRLSVAQTYSEPSGASHSGICAYSGATTIGTKLYVAGGGHLDGAANGIFEYDLSDDAPVAVLLNTPTVTVDQNVTHYTSDGRMSARHTSWDIQGVPARNRIFFMGGWAHYGNGNHSGDNVDAFRLDTNAYESAGTYTAQTGLQSGNAPNAVCQDGSGNIYVFCNNDSHLYKWTQSSATWSDLGYAGLTIVYNNPCAYDPVNNRIVYINGASSVYYSLGSSTFTTFTGPAGAASFFWCGDLDVFLYKSFTSTTIEQVHPTTWVKTTYSVSGTAPSIIGGNDGIDNMYGRIGWNEPLGIVYCLTQNSTNLSAFRTR